MMSDLKRPLPGLRPCWIIAFAAIVATAAFANAALAQKIELKIGSVTIRDTVHQWMDDFKKNVENRIGDKIDVRVFPAGQLGNNQRQIEGIQLGTQEMHAAPPDFFVGLDRRYMVTSVPGVFTSLRHAQKVLHDPRIKEQLFTMGEPKGITGVGLYVGDLSFYVSKNSIRTIGDFRGKKVRVFASAIERETIERLGAAAVPMPLGDVLPALQQGAIDSVRSGIGIFVAFKYWTAAKYLTATNEGVIAVVAMASKTWWDKLPREIRTVLLQEGERTDWQVLEFSEKFMMQNRGLWQSNGGELIELSAADRAQMRRMLSTVGDSVVNDLPDVKGLYDEMKAIAARTPDN
jgi:TRAP-type C4-dicarboxylate transport system substrate-binding protein